MRSENFLLSTDIGSLSNYLAVQDWLEPGEKVEHAERAGEGNMNCVLRIATSIRTFILKQSRPWVEKYPSIAAPRDRALSEGQFYRGTQPFVGEFMPKLIAIDPAARLLMLQDLGVSREFTFLYGPEALGKHELTQLVDFLLALHNGTRAVSGAAVIENREMRQLNHEHIFALPLREKNGLNLDSITLGLVPLAAELQSDGAYCREVGSLGELYLGSAAGKCLLHGDYFPGSWLRAEERVYVIDPEFCFHGPPEWDLGVMLAHMHLAAQPNAAIVKRYAAAAPIDKALASRFAGVEIMRRLIGVAQLPVDFSLDRKRDLLALSKALVLGEATA